RRVVDDEGDPGPRLIGRRIEPDGTEAHPAAPLVQHRARAGVAQPYGHDVERLRAVPAGPPSAHLRDPQLRGGAVGEGGDRDRTADPFRLDLDLQLGGGPGALEGDMRDDRPGVTLHSGHWTHRGEPG